MKTLLPLLALSFACGPAPAAGPAAEDAQDVVFLHDQRPYRIRLRLRVDGRSFSVGWADGIELLFRHLDADGNGLLDRGELARAPSIGQWGQIQRGEEELEPDAAPPIAEVDGRPADGKVTLAELRGYYRRAGGGPLHVQVGRYQTSATALDDALFRHLDRNGDGVLTRAELQDAPRSLARLDADADDMIGTRELVGDTPLPEAMFVFDTAQELPFFLLHPGDPIERLVARLQARPDRRLNRDELARWFAGPPDLEVVVPLGRAAVSDDVTISSARGLPARPRLSPEGSLLLPFGKQRLELSRSWHAPPAAATESADLQQEGRLPTRERFRQMDRDGNGLLDSKEVYQPPFTFVTLLRLADHDGDGKLSEKEFLAFTELVGRVRSTSTFLVLLDRGRMLFDLLDADHDRRLSRRELNAAWERLAPWAQGDASAVKRDRLPRQFQLTVCYGEPWLIAGRPTVGRPQRGPLWFRKMDRNRDGDVSPGEFLGTAAQFRRLDRDGDGLIDAREAERGDALLRRRKRD